MTLENPMLEAVLDYETRSAKPLELSGAIEYAKDPTTSIFCLGYQVNDAEPKIWIPERCPMPDDLWECFKSGTLIAHNAAFERAITKYVLPRYSCLTSEQQKTLASLPISRWRCLAAKAAMCSLPRKLEGAAKALKLATQKDAHGHKLIKKYSKPRKPSKNNPAPWWSDKKDLRDIYRYCLTDVKAERELHDALPDLSDFEQSVWELDQKINDRGVLIDIPTVKKILVLVNEEMREITKRVQVLSRGEIDSPTQRAKVLEWINKRGAKMANLQAPTIRDRLLGDDLTPQVRSMLEYRQGGSKTSVSKYYTMLEAVGEDHRARELLLYCGTIPTARWSGKRIQPQNFPRPTVKEPGQDFFDSDKAIRIALKRGRKGLAKRYGKTKVMDVLVSIIRGMLIASIGHDLYCADFAAVEARIAFWVADHVEGIKAFEEKRKLYEEMASEAFGIPISQVTKNSIERFVGKESVLGCQYGLGWAKFLRNCHQKGVKQVTPDMAKKAVYTYRKIHHPIPEFWKKIEDACIQAVLNPGKRYRVTKVTVYVSDKWLNIKLPSGRRLRYFKPRVTQKQLASSRMVPEIRYWTVDGYTRQWIETSIWGGVFLNHIVQGISRDLMVNGVIQIENAGYKFLLSVHDEGLAEKKKGLGNVDEFVKLMTKLPVWAKGAPITAEGWSGPRYKKG
jgi:DNA polymerase